MSAEAVSALRARPGIVRLGDLTADAIPLRVQVPEVWDALQIAASPSTPLLEVKRHALRALIPDEPNAEDFVVKLAGWEVLDETATLSALRVKPGATLLITSRRRRPVR
ncbi:MAG: hypothetical protein ACT4R6_05070 [Gemmatimonadaceae bacterium]